MSKLPTGDALIIRVSLYNYLKIVTGEYDAYQYYD